MPLAEQTAGAVAWRMPVGTAAWWPLAEQPAEAAAGKPAETAALIPLDGELAGAVVWAPPAEADAWTIPAGEPAAWTPLAGGPAALMTAAEQTAGIAV